PPRVFTQSHALTSGGYSVRTLDPQCRSNQAGRQQAFANCHGGVLLPISIGVPPLSRLWRFSTGTENPESYAILWKPARHDGRTEKPDASRPTIRRTRPNWMEMEMEMEMEMPLPGPITTSDKFACFRREHPGWGACPEIGTHLQDRRQGRGRERNPGKTSPLNGSRRLRRPPLSRTSRQNPEDHDLIRSRANCRPDHVADAVTPHPLSLALPFSPSLVLRRACPPPNPLHRRYMYLYTRQQRLPCLPAFGAELPSTRLMFLKSRQSSSPPSRVDIRRWPRKPPHGAARGRVAGSRPRLRVSVSWSSSWSSS
ncbi:hypothetical protein CSHISOI_06646, partial [Colletotrichum shisoi]